MVNIGSDGVQGGASEGNEGTVFTRFFSVKLLHVSFLLCVLCFCPPSLKFPLVNE